MLTRNGPIQPCRKRDPVREKETWFPAYETGKSMEIENSILVGNIRVFSTIIYLTLCERRIVFLKSAEKLNNCEWKYCFHFMVIVAVSARTTLPDLPWILIQYI